MKRTTLKKDNSEAEESEQKTVLKREILAKDCSKKEKSEKETLEMDKSGKEAFEKGQIWKGTF